MMGYDMTNIYRAYSRSHPGKGTDSGKGKRKDVKI